MPENLREARERKRQSRNWLSFVLIGTMLGASNVVVGSPVVRSRQSYLSQDISILNNNIVGVK